MGLNEICLSDVVGSHTEVWTGESDNIRRMAEILSESDSVVMFHISRAPGDASVAWLHPIPRISKRERRVLYVLRGIFESETAEMNFEGFFQAARSRGANAEARELKEKQAANDAS